MTIETPASDDYVSHYMAIHERLAAAVIASECRQAVPACPGWQVRDLLAHLTGLCEDWVDQRLDGYASDTWTANQVERFADRTCQEILGAWAEVICPFSQVETTLLGRPAARWAFGDAVVHEGDIRGAMHAGRVPDDAVLLGLLGTLGRWTTEVLEPAGLTPLRILTSEGKNWVLGHGANPEAELEVPTYELFRALAGRRSAEQVSDWTWSCEPRPYIQAGLPYPFRWADAFLND